MKSDISGEGVRSYCYRHDEPEMWAQFTAMAHAAGYVKRLSELLNELVVNWMQRRLDGGTIEDYLSGALWGWVERYAAKTGETPQEFVRHAVRDRCAKFNPDSFRA